MRRIVLALHLLFALEAVAQCRYTSELRCGQTVSNRLENATCKYSNVPLPYHIYYVNATAGTILDIFLSSDAFPPYLAIYYEDESTVRATDDGLSIARITYDVPRTGFYRILAGAYDSSTKGSFSLSMFCETVCLRPFATGGRDNQSIAYGGRATLTAAIDGSRPWTWRWFDEANPSVTLGTTPEKFTTPPLFQTTEIGVTVTNACGSVTRTAGIVTVSAQPCTMPAITVQPTDFERGDGPQPTFTVVATGTGPLTYSWYRGSPPDTSSPVNVTTATFNAPIPPSGQNPSYWVRVSNACGYADSVAVDLKWYQSRRRSVRH